ncbi:MAG: hypothetical protein ACKVJK_18405, partial [Methylophagaceae bacterium]
MVVNIGTVSANRNAKLASIIAPASTTLESNAAVAITIEFNSLAATSTVAVLGSALAEVKQPSFTTWKTYIGQCVAAGIATVAAGGATYTAAGGSIAHSLDFDVNGDTTTANI